MTTSEQETVLLWATLAQKRDMQKLAAIEARDKTLEFLATIREQLKEEAPVADVIGFIDEHLKEAREG